jgi:hypothetical protein
MPNTERKKKNRNQSDVILEENEVKDIRFFEEDIKEMSKQLASGEKLYSDLFNIYTSFTGGRYSNMKSPRDIAEIAKALVQIRGLCSDAAFRRHQMRKNISDTVYRNTGGETTNDDIVKLAARTIINEVRNYEKNNIKSNKNENASILTDEIRRQLDAKVEGYIEKGDILLSTNDRLIGLSNHVEFKYDKDKEEFVAVDERNGRVIPDFPKERLPEKQISRFNKNGVVTRAGDSYAILGEE